MKTKRLGLISCLAATTLIALPVLGAAKEIGVLRLFILAVRVLWVLPVFILRGLFLFILRGLFERLFLLPARVWLRHCNGCSGAAPLE